MKKLFLIVMLLPTVAFCKPLGDVKKELKEGNLKSFYDHEFSMKYPMEKIIKALLGIEGDPAEIKAYYLKIQGDRQAKEAQVDAAKNEDEAKAILGVMKHE